MLDQLRGAVNSWPAKILLILILLSFVAWGGHSAFQGGSDDTLITADKNSVEAPTYDLTLRNAMMRLSMSAGRYITPDEAKNFGINQAVFSQVYRNLLLDNQVENLGIGVSDKIVADTLAKDPLFSTQNGQFDVTAFNYYLQNLQVKRDVFIDDFYAKPAKRTQITATIQDKVNAPSTFYKALALYQMQKRDVSYLELKPANIGTIANPDQQTLEDWFKEHNGEFTVPELREISFISLKPEDVAKPEEVSQQEVADFYKANKEHYIESDETRDFDLIRFKTREQADQAEQKLNTMLDQGLSPRIAFNTYTDQNKTEVEHKENVGQKDLPNFIGNEVFALKTDKISPVINDLSGPAIVFVTKITPEKTANLESVSSEIRQSIANQKAAEILPQYRQKIENARFDGARLNEISEKNGWKLNTVLIDNSGNDAKGQPVDFPQKDTFLPNIFAAAENIDTDPLNLQNGGYLWYNVDKIIPSRLSNLNEVQDKAIAAWKNSQLQQKLDQRATELANDLNKGDDISKLADDNGLKVENIPDMQRSPANIQIGQTATNAIFASVDDESGYSIGTSPDTRIIFQVNKIIEPKEASEKSLNQEEQQNVIAGFERDLFGSYISGLAAETPVKVNPTVYNRLLGDSN